MKSVGGVGFFLLLFTSLSSQWSIDLDVQPYPPPYVSQWETQPGIATLSVTNNSSQADTVKVYLEITCSAYGTILIAISDPQVFDPGETKSTDNTDVSEWSGWSEFNESLKEQITRSGRLPEGSYELCIDVKKASTDELYAHECASFEIVAPSPPSLVSPEDGDTILTPNPTFIWTPVTVPTGFEVTYHLRICEVIEGQTKEEAIQNYPHYEVDIDNQTSYLYPPDAPDFDSGKTYVWQVQVLDASGQPLGENNGKSEIWEFAFGVSAPEAVEFEIESISIILPDTIYVGQTVKAKLALQAAPGASGHVVGAIYIDGVHWLDFGEDVSDTDTIESYPLAADTTDTGSHWIKFYVELPNEKVDSAKYFVKIAKQLVPGLDSLIVVPDLAYLYNITGTAQNISPGKFLINGTGKLRIAPFDNETLQVTIDSLKISLNQSHPESSQVLSGRLIKEGEDTFLFSLYYDALRINKVEYVAPAEQLIVDGQLFLPYGDSSSPLLTLEDIIVTSNGIEGKGFSTVQQFTMFGFAFQVHDIGPHKAIEIGYDKENDIFWVSLSGSIKLRMHGKDTTILNFSDFKFNFSDDDFTINGVFALTDPLRFITGNDYVLLDSLSFTKEEDWYLYLKGRVNLPPPFDTLGAKKFSLKMDFDGNAVGGINIVGPESPSLGSGDPTEFDLWIVTFDLTYLGLKLKLSDGELIDDQCEIQLTADMYFPIIGDTQKTRVSLGKKVGGTIYPGITVDFDGNVDWKAEYLGDIDVLHDKKVDLEMLYMYFENVAIQPIPFEIHITGTFGLNFQYVSGSVSFTNLRIDEDGEFVNIGQAITGGSFCIYNIVDIELDTIAFGEDTTLTYVKNTSTSMDAMRHGNGQIDTVSVDVDSYFMLTGAHITIGTDLASGGFDKLLVYEKGSDKHFFIKGVDVSIAGTQLLSNFEYSNPSLKIAGAVTLPNGAGGVVVGRMGENSQGDPSFGFFFAAQDLNIQVYASVFLNDLGGGFFYNPEPEDIDAVREMCSFNREKMGTIDEKKPEPGAFGILLYAGLYVANENMIEGRALMSLTENNWSLDAEITALEKKFLGDFYLDISWSPAYMQGEFNINVNFYEIAEGQGNGAFYVYSSDIWGIQMNGNVEILPSISLATLGVDYFLGPPGFLFETDFHASIDLYVLEGGVDFDMMFWWQKNVSWGAYANLYAHAEILGGLAGVSGGLEGAFIGEPEYVIYCVGEFEAECCWITVFSGNIWITLSGDGLDGGTGRNSHYDQIIEDAKHMADQMEEDMDSLMTAMEEAVNGLFTVSQEQIEQMGQQLIQVLVVGHYSLQWNFFYNFYNADKNIGSPNPVLESVFNNVLFNPENKKIGAGKDTLDMMADEIQELIQELDDMRYAVSQKLQQYRNLLQSELPSIRELDVQNPVGNPVYATVNINGSTITVQTGFGFNEEQASSNTENVAGVKQDIEAYREMLNQLVNEFSKQIDTIEAILYSEPNPVFELSTAYASAVEKIADYYERYFNYLYFVETHASNMVYNLSSSEATIKYAIHNQTERAYTQAPPAARLSLIRNLVSYREQTLHELDSTFPLHYYLQLYQQTQPEDSVDFWMNACDSAGVMVWYSVPRAGFSHLATSASQFRDTLREAYRNTVNQLSSNWIRYTGDLGYVFDRESRLFELLYDLYDQLSILTTEGMWVWRRGGGTFAFGGPILVYLTPEQLRMEYAAKRDSIGEFLTVPQITSFSGYARSYQPDFARIHMQFSATHPVSVVEYSYSLMRETSSSSGNSGSSGGSGWFFFPQLYLVPLFRSVGLNNVLDIPLMKGIDEEGTYDIYIKARGKGGYTITRQGVVEVNYWAGGPTIVNNITSIDTTPPTTPVVYDDGEFTSSTEMLHATWQASDPQSGIQEYYYSVGEVFCDPFLHFMHYMPTVKNWTSAGGMTELNIRNLNLENGKTYYIAVKAVNGEGMTGPMGLSDGITVDVTPPPTPEIITLTRSYYQGPQTIFLRWQEVVDSQSVVTAYEYALGTAPFATDLKDWTQISPVFKRVYIPNLLLREGDTVYAQVRAVNAVNMRSDPDTAMLVIHFNDMTPPTEPVVEASRNPRTGRINVSWQPSEDHESGIVEYQYRVLARRGANREWEEIKPWTFVGLQTSATCRLQGNYSAFEVQVKAINGAGLYSIGEKTF